MFSHYILASFFFLGYRAENGPFLVRKKCEEPQKSIFNLDLGSNNLLLNFVSVANQNTYRIGSVILAGSLNIAFKGSALQYPCFRVVRMLHVQKTCSVC